MPSFNFSEIKWFSSTANVLSFDNLTVSTELALRLRVDKLKVFVISSSHSRFLVVDSSTDDDTSISSEKTTRRGNGVNFNLHVSSLVLSLQVGSLPVKICAEW